MKPWLNKITSSRQTLLIPIFIRIPHNFLKAIQKDIPFHLEQKQQPYHYKGWAHFPRHPHCRLLAFFSRLVNINYN